MTRERGSLVALFTAAVTFAAGVAATRALDARMPLLPRRPVLMMPHSDEVVRQGAPRGATDDER